MKEYSMLESILCCEHGIANYKEGMSVSNHDRQGAITITKGFVIY